MATASRLACSLDLAGVKQSAVVVRGRWLDANPSSGARIAAGHGVRMPMPSSVVAMAQPNSYEICVRFVWVTFNTLWRIGASYQAHPQAGIPGAKVVPAHGGPGVASQLA